MPTREASENEDGRRRSEDPTMAARKRMLLLLRQGPQTAAQLAGLLGVSERTVYNYAKWLEERGVLERTGGQFVPRGGAPDLFADEPTGEDMRRLALVLRVARREWSRPPGALGEDDLWRALGDRYDGRHDRRNPSFRADLDWLVEHRYLRRTLDSGSRRYLLHPERFFTPSDTDPALAYLQALPRDARLRLLQWLDWAIGQAEAAAGAVRDLQSAWRKVNAMAYLVAEHEEVFSSWLSREDVWMRGPSPAGPGEESRFLGPARAARLEGRLLQLRLLGKDGEWREERVIPLCVAWYGTVGGWYLLADVPSMGQRLWYREDMVSEIAVWRPAPVDLDLLSAAWAPDNAPAIDVRVAFQAEMNVPEKLRLAQQRHGGTITRRGDRLIYAARVAGYGGFVHWLRQFGGNVEVLAPAELAWEYHEEGPRRIFERYADLEGGGADGQATGDDTRRGERGDAL